MKTIKAMKTKRIMLWAVLITAFCVGIWFFVSPYINRQADLEQQNELLDSIIALLPPYLIVESEIEPPVIADESLYADESGHGEHGEQGENSEHEDGAELGDNGDFGEICAESTDDGQGEEEYESCDAPPLEPLDEADFPSGIIPIGILTIDSIDLRLPVKEGVKEPELRIAPGRVPETANVGEIGNAVIAGHRNFTFGSMFNRLGEVENGDIIGFQAMNGQQMAFEVFEILVITPDNQIAFIQPINDTIITLYTCTPIREATHRLLIRARKIEGGL